MSLLVAFLMGCISAFAQVPTPADLILTNGKIFTDHDEGRTWSESLSIRGGNIASIGSSSAILKEKGPHTKVIDLKGRVALPGFNDAHVHFLNGALALSRVDLSTAKSTEEVREKVRAYAEANPLKRWIFGGGWDQARLKEKRPLNKTDIDAAVSDRPVMLWHSDQHSLVVNSKALDLLKIKKEEHTGLLSEDAAWNAANKFDAPSFEELKKAFEIAQDLALQHGITSVQGPLRGLDEARVVAEMHRAGQLKLRFAFWGELAKPEVLTSLRERYKELPEEWVRFEGLKGYVDGVLHNRTAALFDPYSDATNASGELFYKPAELNELVINANRLGFPVALHAVGDRAAAMAMNAFAGAKRQLFNSRVRNRIEHLEVVPPHIYPKFAQNNVIASAQPSHLVYASPSENTNERRLGRERIKHVFALRSFFKARAHVAFGSDWPVMPLNPLLGLFGAVYRQNEDGNPRGGWRSEQKLTMEQAIEAYTLGGAYATREEHVKGTLREGKYADIVVLEKDPFDVKATELPKIPVYMTIVAGKVVHDGSKPQISAPQ